MPRELTLAAAYRRFIRPRLWIPFVLSGLVVVAGWVFVPTAFNPYVRVESSNIEFSLGCLPRTIEVDFRTAALPSTVTATFNVQSAPAADEMYTATSFQAADGLTGYLIEAPEKLHAFALSLGSHLRRVRYSMFFGQVPAIDIQKLQIHQSPQDLGDCSAHQFSGSRLLNIIVNPSKHLMRYRLLQEDVGDVLYTFNGSFSNVVLGLMIVAFFWQIYVVSIGAYRAYLSGDEVLVRDARQRCTIAPPALSKGGSVATIRADFAYMNRRLSFAKTLGPAVGFLLTVSSLSAALHTSAAATQDTFRFLSGIQIAIVATFVGLAIRIVAQFGQRAYRDMSERQLALLTPTPLNVAATARPAGPDHTPTTPDGR